MHINDIFETEILRLNNEGLGVALINNFVVFVRNALTGEKVKIIITDVMDNYAYASTLEVNNESNNRVIPKCPYYDKCGGCNLMHMNYEMQKEFKINKVKSIFKKISNIDIDINEIITDKEYNYRNKVTLKVNKDKIGFYKEKTNELLDINNCLIIDEKINEEIKKIKEFITLYKDNNISEIMIRVINDKVMFSIDNISNNLKDIFIDNFKHIDSIYINNNHVYNSELLVEEINGLKFNISPKSFFQVNKVISKKMYDKAISYISSGDLTLDLYSGTGTLSLLASKNSNRVIGVEVVKDAVKDANNNKLNNNIGNVSFICDKVENQIDKLSKENVDNIILDPPRSGSDKKTLNAILKIEPKKLIYISCNPVTLSRDYNILKEKYSIKEITLFDMFPNTYHVESVVVLERR